MTVDEQLNHEHHKNNSERISLPISLVLDGLKTPANVGSLFRLADALGVEELIFINNAITPPNKNITRTARSTEKNIPWRTEQNCIAAIEHLKQSGYEIVALELTKNSAPITNYTVSKGSKLALVLGAESTGVSNEVLSLCDAAAYIPMRGINSSMNVAMAAAIAIYQFSEQLTV